ncbi:MAG: sugar phosphate nucleotidyltransferase [Candidatus Electryonea clarkiae]|nr:sugar phosphate nucleotidyltransferase [Candidatus Electryonea clarkiae]MDP8287719.1 sugar phosphate nucleotidyltransferase [Candidatus Electryonea clarkiae]
MKGIVLAGGMGSRLAPLTKVTNKHLLPVGLEPMIHNPIKKLLGAGVEDILVVTGPEHMGHVVGLLGSGKDFNCRFTYKVQDEAGGIAQALGLAEQFVGDDQVAVILGDNIFEDSIRDMAIRFRKQGTGAKVVLKEVTDPERFGVAEIKDGVIVDFVEKPENPKSDKAVVGIYFYDHNVFEIIRQLKPSARGELEITDVNNGYLERGELSFEILKGWWTDAGTHESIRIADQYWRETWGENPEKIPAVL